MRELRNWLLALMLIITGGIVSFAAVVIWLQVTIDDWYEPDGFNMPPASPGIVLLLFSLMLGVWVLALTARVFELVVKRITRP